MDTLTQIAIKYGTDKFGSHHYTPIYSEYFEPRRNDKLRLLEIGYGGYGNPDSGGESARVWVEFFPNAEIVVTDIYPKNMKGDEHFTFKQGNQTDDAFMKSLGSFDICIDDGSHNSADILQTFNTMFPLMNDDGIYIVEDTQTAFWAETVLGERSTDYFKRLTDGLNHAEIRRGKYTPSYLEANIFSIHFYHNLIIILKGDNTKPSNVVRHE